MVELGALTNCCVVQPVANCDVEACLCSVMIDRFGLKLGWMTFVRLLRDSVFVLLYHCLSYKTLLSFFKELNWVLEVLNVSFDDVNCRLNLAYTRKFQSKNKIEWLMYLQ